MALIPTSFINSVVTISVENPNHSKFCIGTGFLVGDLKNEANNKKKYALYLITNKHVLRDKNTVYVGFKKAGLIGSYDFPLKLTNNGAKEYSEHPNPNVDIAAVSINVDFLASKNAKYSFFAIDENCLTINQGQEMGLSEGDLVYSIGYPLNLVGTSSKEPICRIGCVSRISDLFVPGHPEVSFIVGAQSFPGNSGGPIILRPDSDSLEGTKAIKTSYLLGILYSYVAYQDPLISQQTGEIYSIMKENSGLTNVHPVDYIIDVVKIEDKRIGGSATLFEKLSDKTDTK